MSPAMMACSGHTTTQAGSNPRSTRWLQKWHLAAVLVSGSMWIASYGHACMQALQPMHSRLSNSTIPSARWYMAPVGQIRAQGGFSQWLQRVTWKSRVLFG